MAALFLPRAISSSEAQPIGESNVTASAASTSDIAGADAHASIRVLRPAGGFTFNPVLPNASVVSHVPSDPVASRIYSTSRSSRLVESDRSLSRRVSRKVVEESAPPAQAHHCACVLCKLKFDDGMTIAIRFASIIRSVSRTGQANRRHRICLQASNPVSCNISASQSAGESHTF